jgi:hypothetical protein
MTYVEKVGALVIPKTSCFILFKITYELHCFNYSKLRTMDSIITLLTTVTVVTVVNNGSTYVTYCCTSKRSSVTLVWRGYHG